MFARMARSSGSTTRLLSSSGSGGSLINPKSLLASSTVNKLRHLSVMDYKEANSEAKQLKTSFHLPDPTVKHPSGRMYHPLTKIVATIGPTSEQEGPLKRVVKAGMKIMRLNFSHATVDEVELRMKNLALSQARRLTNVVKAGGKSQFAFCRYFLSVTHMCFRLFSN